MKLMDHINELRSHPETNIKTPVWKQMIEYIKGLNPNNVFVSFRDTIHDGKTINLNTEYDMRGIFTYPYLNYVKSAINNSINGNNFDWELFWSGVDLQITNHARYIYVYELKNWDGMLDTNMSKDDILPYAKKAYSLTKNQNFLFYIDGTLNTEGEFDSHEIQPSGDIMRDFGNDTIGYDTGKGESELAKFMIAIERSIKSEKLIDGLCRKIGVNGIVDRGTKLIHYAEPEQTVIFNPRIIKDYRVFDSNYDLKYSPRNISKPIANIKITPTEFETLPGYPLSTYLSENDFKRISIIYDGKQNGSGVIGDNLVIILTTENLIKSLSTLNVYGVKTIGFPQQRGNPPRFKDLSYCEDKSLLINKRKKQIGGSDEIWLYEINPQEILKLKSITPIIK